MSTYQVVPGGAVNMIANMFSDDVDGNTHPVLLDRVTGATAAMTTDHTYIHEGIAYTAPGTFQIANSKVGTIEITTPSVTAAVAASLTSDMTNALADITLTAVTAGADGNDITVRYVDPSANNAALAVTVSGQAITVSLATNGSGVITSTAAQVKAAINAHAAASALVTAEDEGVGSGVVNAKTIEGLSGGTDASYIHFKPAFIATSAAVAIAMWEGSTQTGTEVAVTPRNRNRLADDDSSVLVTTCADSTLTTTGAAVLDRAYTTGGGTGSNRFGGAVTAAEEWVMKPATTYHIALTNNSGGAADVFFSLFWYEEAGA